MSLAEEIDPEIKPQSDGYALDGATTDWEPWLYKSFPSVATAPPADHHRQFWKWIENLSPDVIPPAFIACWPRGGGKSTTCELGAVRVGVKLTRRFLLVVCERQQQADERVQAISSLFLRYGVKNAVNKLGHSKGWRRDQLRTENGFNVAGIGLDVAARGIKLDEFRPDWVHFDDVDGREDTPRTTQKKERTLTQTILKAGAANLAVSFGQNLIHSESMMARVISNKADFLLDRIVSGPVKAVDNLQTKRVQRPDGGFRYQVIGGTPTWQGQSLAVCEASINVSGLSAFERESQQDVEETDGGLWDRERDIQYWTDSPYCKFDENGEPLLPDFIRVGEGVDPSGSARGDEVGIVLAGSFKLPSGLLCAMVLDDRSGQYTAMGWAKEGTDAFYEWDADKLLAESNFGGEMVEATFQTAEQRDENGRVTRRAPKVTLVRVSRGKEIRADPIQAKYEEGRVFHWRRFNKLEKQQCTWHPNSNLPSPGSLDAAVIVLSDLFGIADYVHPEKAKAVPISFASRFGGSDRIENDY